MTKEILRKKTRMMKIMTKFIRNVGSVLLVISIACIGSVPFFIFKEDIQNLSVAGYAGLFMACFLTNATIFLPASGIAFTISASAVLSPGICCCIGGMGTALGELISFYCGRIGKTAAGNRIILEKAKKYVMRNGFAIVSLFAFLPVPGFDLIGIAAGAGRMPVYKYLSACLIGKTLKMFLFVFVLQEICKI